MGDADPGALTSLRALPAVGTLLASPELSPLLDRFGHALVADAARKTVQSTRERILKEGMAPPITADSVEEAIGRLSLPSLRRILNGTGVLIHTNLGRAPLADEALEAVRDVAFDYCTVELDLKEGVRGDRHSHVSNMLAQVMGTGGGLAVNNNAGAVLLMLSALCQGGEVIVARGELVEIGGGFRIPDVMRASGATLVEVGTTNKVYARDYKEAITDETKAILRVHRSNFALVGFWTEPELPELKVVALEAGIPLLYDMGSGLLASRESLGDAARFVEVEPRPKEAIDQGADVVTFSGDKLLGGPQAGLLAGREDLLASIRKHPLARAVRADKMTMAGLEATLRLYRDGRDEAIPIVRMLGESYQSVEQRAVRIRESIQRCPVAVELAEGESVPGGGSLPLIKLPSKLVVIGEEGEQGRKLAAALRGTDPPLITRMVDDRVAIDARTIRDCDVSLVGRLVEEAVASLEIVVSKDER